MSCKHGTAWSAPVFMELTKGSVGLTLGADASIAAGPVGRTATAATDAQMTAEILSYSRAKGLFAGIDLSGGALQPDSSANMRAYGSNVSVHNIALGGASVPMTMEARSFTGALSSGVRATSGVK